MSRILIMTYPKISFDLLKSFLLENCKRVFFVSY